MTGEETPETVVTTNFNANLRPVLGDRVGMLHWILDLAVGGFIIGYDLSGNQVLIFNFDSDKWPVEKRAEQHARDVVMAATGRPDVEFAVLSFQPWV
jgi:hypothetical protein